MLWLEGNIDKLVANSFYGKTNERKMSERDAEFLKLECKGADGNKSNSKNKI